MQTLRVKVVSTAILLLMVGTMFGQSLKEKVADKYYNQMLYNDAIELYQSVAKKEKTNVRVHRRIAECYAKMAEFDKSEEWYRKVLGMGAETQDYFDLAQVLKSNGKYEEANEMMEKFVAMGGQNKVASGHVEDKQYYVKLKEHADNYDITECSFNSTASDFAPFLLDTATIIFASNRESKDEKGVKSFFVAMYEAGLEENKARNYFAKEFYSKSHNGPLWISKDGNTAYITVSQENKLKDKENEIVKINLRINTLIKKDGEWIEGEPFPYNSAEYSVGNPVFSQTEDTMYFVSDMPGGFGETDIWMSVKQGGNWTKPQNMGSGINTTEKEMFPYVAPNGTFYFASIGHVGLGGLDIYAVYKEDGEMLAPVNVGYPVNTRFDDFGWFFKDENHAYFASNREGGKGNDDIYLVEIKEPVGEPKAPVYLLTCIIKDSITGEEIEAPIVRVYEQEANTNITDSLKEDYSITLFKESSYKFVVEKPGYLASPVYVSGDEKMPEVVNKTIKLRQEGVRLDDVYFDYREAALTDKARKQLDELVEIMKERPNMRIEMGAHTDCRGGYQYNIDLSEKRANSVVNYLVSKGISGDRMRAVGFGETRLVNGCSDGTECTDDQHQMNRRVSFSFVTAFNPDFLASAPKANGGSNGGGNSGSPANTATGPAPTDANGITYKVQIKMTRRNIGFSTNNFNGLSQISVYEHKGWYKYTSGQFASREEARAHRIKCINKGYNGAFVVQFKEGRRIN